MAPRPDRVVVLLTQAEVKVGVQFLKLVLDLELSLAADLLADPRPAGSVTERHDTAPSAVATRAL